MGDQQRPNIVFAVADDASHMSAYGHGFVQTPTFDRVAAEGVLFTNAFTTNPKCAPSRASILAGRQTWTLEEAAIHYGIFPAKFPVYPDLLEAAGVDPAPGMSGSSLLPLLRSHEEGFVDGSRDRVYMGRENHDLGREGDRGYPVRCVRTRDYLYVRNFAPERWPAGNPETGFTNCDSSPTKRLILQQHASGDDTFFSLAFGKRPEEELYDITADPECLNNLAGDGEYDEIRVTLRNDLERELRITGDPRIQGNGDVFDSYEYTGSDAHSWKAWVEGRFEPQWF